MSAKTMTQHTPAELHYHGTSQGVAVFSSTSKSHPDTSNFTYVDVDTLQVACECQAKPGTCWHCDLALTAYAMTRVAGFVNLLSGADLLTTGQRAGLLVATGAATITDTAVYHQCRLEFARRNRRAADVIATQLPPAAYLAA